MFIAVLCNADINKGPKAGHKPAPAGMRGGHHGGSEPA